MTAITETAPAKVNLYLHLTGRRADGYHELDSLAVFTPAAADRLTLTPAAANRLTITGPHAAHVPAGLGPETLLGRGLALFGQITGIAPAVHMDLQKNLPVAAGLGGGSADAAALLRGLLRLYDCSGFAPALHGAAVQLGADVPVCLASRPARMGGIGEALTPAPALPPLWAVLVNPGQPVPTAGVFADFRASGAPFQPGRVLPAAFTSAAAVCQFLARRTYNSLTPFAVARCPAIAEILAALSSAGAMLARLSGSGATCFGLFANAAAAHTAAQVIARESPDWWVAVSGVEQS